MTKSIILITLAVVIVSTFLIRASHSGNIPKITVDEVKKLIDNKADLFLLDVRSDGEYKEGHIKGVVLIPINQLEKRINEVPKDKKVIAICAVGGRSSTATKLLIKNGYTDVHNMVGGMARWRKNGYPVESI